MTKRLPFPSTAQSEYFRGEWPFGVDFSNQTDRVIAVHVGGGDIKYGINWIGPVSLTNIETVTKLEIWAKNSLDEGGYVHLFPADGNADDELKEVTDLDELLNEELVDED